MIKTYVTTGFFGQRMNYSIIAALLLILLSSCEPVFFSEPLPNNEKDIYAFPRRLRGKWVEIEDNEDSLIVTKRFYEKKVRDMVINEEDEVTDPEILTLITANELGEGISSDSSEYLYFHDHKMYFWDEQKEEMSGPNSYQLKNDSLTIFMRFDEFVDLGKNAFLRKFGEGYIFNKKEGNWWSAFYLDLSNKNEIVVRRTVLKDLEQIQKFSDKEAKVLKAKDNSFVIGTWSNAQLLKYLDEGGFSDTIGIYVKQ